MALSKSFEKQLHLKFILKKNFLWTWMQCFPGKSYLNWPTLRPVIVSQVLTPPNLKAAFQGPCAFWVRVNAFSWVVLKKNQASFASFPTVTFYYYLTWWNRKAARTQVIDHQSFKMLALFQSKTRWSAFEEFGIY